MIILSTIPKSAGTSTHATIANQITGKILHTRNILNIDPHYISKADLIVGHIPLSELRPYCNNLLCFGIFDSKLRLPSLIQHTLFDTNIFSGLGYYFNAILNDKNFDKIGFRAALIKNSTFDFFSEKPWNSDENVDDGFDFTFDETQLIKSANLIDLIYTNTNITQCTEYLSNALNINYFEQNLNISPNEIDKNAHKKIFNAIKNFAPGYLESEEKAFKILSDCSEKKIEIFKRELKYWLKIERRVSVKRALDYTYIDGLGLPIDARPDGWHKNTVSKPLNKNYIKIGLPRKLFLSSITLWIWSKEAISNSKIKMNVDNDILIQYPNKNDKHYSCLMINLCQKNNLPPALEVYFDIEDNSAFLVDCLIR